MSAGRARAEETNDMTRLWPTWPTEYEVAQKLLRIAEDLYEAGDEAPVRVHLAVYHDRSDSEADDRWEVFQGAVGASEDVCSRGGSVWTTYSTLPGLAKHADCVSVARELVQEVRGMYRDAHFAARMA